jgi:ATP-dependent DNA helicase RecG
LSRRFHSALGARGEHTRRRGLDREQNKELLVTHLRAVDSAGCPISELQQVLPALSRGQIQSLLDELRRDGRVKLVGERRGAKWILAAHA